MVASGPQSTELLGPSTVLVFEIWESTNKQPLLPPPPLMRGGNIHVFAIFGHGTACELDALRLQECGELVVGERMARVFVFDELFYLALEHEQRCVGAFR